MRFERTDLCHQEVKNKYPDVVIVPVAMWNISFTYYENDKLEDIIAEAYYTTIRLDGKDYDPFLDRNLVFFEKGKYSSEHIRKIK